MGGGFLGGAQLNFGYNDGLANFSAQLGEGDGAYFDYDPNDKEDNNCPGVSAIATARGEIGAGTNADYNVTAEYNFSTGNMSTGMEASYSDPNSGTTYTAGYETSGNGSEGHTAGGAQPTTAAGAGEFAGAGFKITF
jgi:hypothetical protein